MPTETGAQTSRVEELRRIFKGVIVAFVPVLVVGFFLTTTEEQMPAGAVVVAVLQRVLMLALAAAVTAAAGLFGMRLLRAARTVPRSLFAHFLLGVGLGLGTLSLATLAAGSAGLMGPMPSVLVLGVMFVLGIRELRGFGNLLRRKDLPERPRLSPFELLLVFLFLLVLVFQLVLAFNLPIDYDATEYHMAAPARWFQAGRIGFLPGNVYSNLPMNCEMLYLFGMSLTGSLMLGIHFGVVMNAGGAVLAAGAVYVTARRFFSRRAALVAMTLFFTTPWVMVASTVNSYNEMLLAFYLMLAVYAFLEFAGVQGFGWAAISAVLAGLAAGVKYTALAFFPPVVGISVVIAAHRFGRLKRLGAGALYVLIVVAVLSPWLVRNLVQAGNPTYPFLYRWFGGREWSAEQDVKWLAGQLKAAGTSQSGNLLRATWERVVAHRHGSLAAAVLLVLSLGALHERPVRWLLAFVVLWTLLWYFFTHRVDRFWLPMAAPAAVLAGRGLEVFRRKWVRRGLAAALVGALAWQLFVNALVFGEYAAGSYDLKTGNDDFLAKRYHVLHPLVLFARTLEPTQCLMLVGEARTLYLPRNVVASTVFDREVFTSTAGDLGDALAVRRRLRDAGVTHVFVNWFEVGRLRDSYTWTDAAGGVHPGLPPFSPQDFDRLVADGALVEMKDWHFPKARQELRGLSREEMAALPDGRIAAVYAVAGGR